MFGFSPFIAVPVAAAGLGVLVAVYNLFYNLFLHPLRGYPGPWLWRASQIPYNKAWLSGRGPAILTRVHEQYGDVVRVAPDRLSYTHPEAWNDIRGHRKGGHGENGKDRNFYVYSVNNILGASRENHSRYRRSLAHGFSAKSMQDQQPLIAQYVDLLFTRLRAHTAASPSLADDNEHATAVAADGSAIVDLVAYFNFATFDIIGDLAFGAPFDCLASEQYHGWVKAIFRSVEQFGMLLSLRRHALWLLKLLVRAKVLGGGQAWQAAYARDLVHRRLKLETTRPDFVGALGAAGVQDDNVANNKGSGPDSKLRPLSATEIAENMRLVVLAGSETTATALSAAAYYVATLPDVQRRLAAEVRAAFAAEADIDFFSVNALPYMLAVLNEAMRLFPPVPTPLPRDCQPGGDTICGRYVPEGTGLDIWPQAMFHSSRNFTAPEKFLPERWLDDDSIASSEEKTAHTVKVNKDRQHAFQPFSVGPRNCIGKNLAYVEMRLILARLIWNFDLALADPADEKRWLDACRSFNLTMKGPLKIRLTPVKRS